MYLRDINREKLKSNSVAEGFYSKSVEFTGQKLLKDALHAFSI